MSNLTDKINVILKEKQNKLVPENIVQGVQIYDVIGALEVGEGSNVFGMSAIPEGDNYTELFANMNAPFNITGINFGEATSRSLYKMCYNSTGLVSADMPQTRAVTNMSNMFYRCSNLQSVNLRYTNNVTNMSGMFDFCQSLRNVSSFNTSNVTNAANMFNRCSNLTSIGDDFNVSNIINAFNMFAFCENLRELPENMSFDNVTNVVGLFNACHNLSTLPTLNLTNISDVSFLYSGTNINAVPEIIFNPDTTYYGTCLFSGCHSLENLSNLRDMKFSNDCSSMFSGCSKLTEFPRNIINLSKPYLTLSSIMSGSGITELRDLTFNNCSRLDYAFSDCPNLTTIENVHVNNCSYVYRMFEGNPNLTTITNCTFSKLSSIGELFGYCNNLRDIRSLENSFDIVPQIAFYKCPNLTEVPYFNATKVEFYSLFALCNNLSDNAVQNIINMCINYGSTYAGVKNLSVSNYNSPFYSTNITNARYQNRLSELSAAGWTY